MWMFSLQVEALLFQEHSAGSHVSRARLGWFLANLTVTLKHVPGTAYVKAEPGCVNEIWKHVV